MRKKKLCLSRLLPVIAALLVLVMFRTVFILGYVPTNSMKPTLEAGSLILGVRIKGSFEVGDVVIFCHGGNLFVKRIAAVGGNVVMHNGINMSVPEGSYYMLGDNADDSYDSRYWDEPFIVLATENPVGSAGTQMLPASQLDRFMLQLSMGYPNRASTAALLKDRHHVDPLSACQTVTSPAELEKLIAEVSNIYVADRIYDYIAELVDLTRSNAYVTLGVSPRGALAVTRAAKANAYLGGRDYVIPDDVCAVFPDVCVHRLILNSKARLQDYTAALILQNVLTSVQKPDVREFSSK